MVPVIHTNFGFLKREERDGKAATHSLPPIRKIEIMTDDSFLISTSPVSKLRHLQKVPISQKCHTDDVHHWHCPKRCIVNTLFKVLCIKILIRTTDDGLFRTVSSRNAFPGCLMSVYLTAGYNWLHTVVVVVIAQQLFSYRQLSS